MKFHVKKGIFIFISIKIKINKSESASVIPNLSNTRARSREFSKWKSLHSAYYISKYIKIYKYIFIYNYIKIYINHAFGSSRMHRNPWSLFLLITCSNQYTTFPRYRIPVVFNRRAVIKSSRPYHDRGWSFTRSIGSIVAAFGAKKFRGDSR